MSEFFFGVGSGRIPEVRAVELDTIARRHGARFIAVGLPEGPRYWFTCPNKGAPFDDATARRVFAALRDAGIDPANLKGAAK